MRGPTVSDALRAARLLIDAGWNPHFARRYERVGSNEVRSIACEWSHPDAYEFTITDALMRATDGNVDLVMAAEETLRAELARLDDLSVSHVEDDRHLETLDAHNANQRTSFEPISASVWAERNGRQLGEVLALLDVAIARAEGAEFWR